jgi:hypothetical protein
MASPFLTLSLNGGEWSASHPGHFTRGQRDPGIHCIGRWVDPRSGLDASRKQSYTYFPARSPSLYRLSCPGFPLCNRPILNLSNSLTSVDYSQHFCVPPLERTTCGIGHSNFKKMRRLLLCLLLDWKLVVTNFLKTFSAGDRCFCTWFMNPC